jgi:orotate phosphoribosyltransferase-like protein
VEGQKVVLIDDYKTSGTTIKEMLRQLADAGAAEVVVFVLIKLGE